MAHQREKSGSHPRDVEKLDFALYGVVDEAGRAVARHVDACAVCGDEVARVRLAHRVLTEHPPLPDRVSELAHEVLGSDWSDAEAEDWIVAEPIPAMAGYRVARTDEHHLNCTVGDRHIDVLLHPGRQNNEFAVSGQVLRSDGTPAAGDTVVLLLDHRPAQRTRTNGYGEFEFDARRGAHLGIRLGDDTAAPKVLIWSEVRRT